MLPCAVLGGLGSPLPLPPSSPRLGGWAELSWGHPSSRWVRPLCKADVGRGCSPCTHGQGCPCRAGSVGSTGSPRKSCLSLSSAPLSLSLPLALPQRLHSWRMPGAAVRQDRVVAPSGPRTSLVPPWALGPLSLLSPCSAPFSPLLGRTLWVASGTEARALGGCFWMPR